MAIILKHEPTGSVTIPEANHTSIFVDSADGELKLKDINGVVYNISNLSASNVITASKPQYHSSNLSGLAALYNFNNNVSDSSGNGLSSLSVVGTERYSETIPGLRGFYFDGANELQNSTDTELGISGNLSIACIVNTAVVASSELVAFKVFGETEDTNYLYSIGFDSNQDLQYLIESGSGTDITHVATDRIPAYTAAHLTLVRENNDVKFYINGALMETTSSGLNGPTGGSNSLLIIGDTGFEGVVSSLAIFSRSLNESEVKNLYNDTLGTVFGDV